MLIGTAGRAQRNAHRPQPAAYLGIGKLLPSTQLKPAIARPSASKSNHTRARSFAVRRPQARVVELLHLCDTAIEIGTPAIKEISSQIGEFRLNPPRLSPPSRRSCSGSSPAETRSTRSRGLRCYMPIEFSSLPTLVRAEV